ncbi:SDR family oxidoreductase [Carboxylicivirga sp. N1Y90]|uniref:SDR family oxidoreductase n=1 Tax=Carboxylicivirga fragile TaxID=3417571 RepID=UPI003D345182|nr:SDR family oxidoreductase [Marinilabiliaceae bacterium N1Y90]
MKRKICITGASKGIGLSEAELLSKENELFLHASEISSFNDCKIKNAHFFGQDFTEINNVEKFVNQLKEKTKGLDVLVNNVGVMVIDSISDFSDNDINKLVTLNLHSQLLLTKKIIPMLLESDDPHIVFMSSMSAKNRIVGESIYAATKAGIMQFAHVLRNELAGKIKVSTIYSWGVNTWNDNANAKILKPENIAETLDFIISREKPFLIESIELGHFDHWNGANAPWSPE